MKADHATWETGLVIPEPTVDPVHATLLRIEELLQKLLVKGMPVVPDAEEREEMEATLAKPKKGKTK